MRIVRRLMHALIIVLTLIVGATAAAIIVSQTAWFKNWLRGYIVVEANKYLNGQLSIQRLGGNLFFGVELENVGVSMDGSQVVAVEDLGIKYNVFEMITRGLSVDEIAVNKPVLYLRRDGDAWSITRLVKKQAQEADRSGPQYPIAIDDIGISDASVVIDSPVGTSGVAVPKRIDRIDAKLSFKYEPVRYSIDITHVSFRGSDPAIGLNALSGGVAVRNDTVYVDKLALRTEESSLSVDGAVQNYLTKPVFNVRISSDKLSLPEIARVVPALAGVRLQPAFELKLDGPLDHLGVDMNVRSSAGQVTGKLVADVMAPKQSVAGDVSVRHLDLAPLLKDPRQKSDITADARLDLHSQSFSDLDSLRGTASVSAPRVVAAGYTAEKIRADASFEGRKVALKAQAAAYGASATANGSVTVPPGKEPLAFDLRGTARHLDLRNLPRDLKVPPADTDVNADYHVAGSMPIGSKAGPDLKADAAFIDSTVAGARIENGSRVSVDMRGKALSYDVDATVGGADLQRIGETFNLPALAAERYKSDLNAHLVANGSGTTLQDLDVKASGTISESTILGGRVPQLSFDAAVAGDAAHVTANGSFAEFDPAVVSGKPAMKGTVGGSLDVNADLTGLSKGVTPDTVAGTVKLTLDRSTIGGLAIERGSLDADYHEQSGEIRQLEVVGRDVNVTAKGALALNDSGQSNLTFHADTPNLAEIAKLVDVPLTGIAKVDGTLTGNRTELQAKGTLIGDGVKYEENGALTISSDYTVTVPDLAFERAHVDADTHATFVTVAGQDINELAAKTTYEDKKVTFEATAKQPERSAMAGGSLVLHPDHQEVHLQSLGLTAGQQQWSLVNGQEATINYAADAVRVEGLKLANGGQQISADGAFGRPGDALNVTLSNVDVAGVNALLLRPPQFSGRLNASAKVTGSKDAPAVEGTFDVTQGAFRQFTYDTLGGTVAYSGQGVTVDAKLQQNPTQWISAKGYLPTAVFSATPELERDTHVEPSTPADRVDLTIDSSPLDLGLVQGFTTALTNVRGTLEAHLRVTGSAEDPHPSGRVTIANGALHVEPTGGDYAYINGNVDFQSDRVHIDQITVLDNHNSSLSVTGDLAVHGRNVGGVNVWINADDFKILDNKLGNVRIQSAIEVAGDLRSPIIQGDAGVTTGQVDLDQILALFGTSAYATKETDYSDQSDNAGQTPAPAAGFSAARMNLRFTVPNDLRIKASSLQPAGAPVSLGALNLTLGGDMTVEKAAGDAPRVRGVVKTIRGSYDFQGRRFEILRDGTVRFEGLNPPNPTLDVRTRRMIQGVEARVMIRGTLRKPEIVLESTPPLEQADILALIVFNQPINQLGEGQQVSLAARAQAIATSAVAGQLAQSIGNVLHLDTFEINAAPEEGGGPQVTVGQQVGQNLYIRVQQGVGDDATTNFILEYDLTNWLRVQTNVVNGSNVQQSLFRRAQSTGGDFIFFFSF
ncbi:MAG TPA: translocation/assembly module TamB domain-containing protein [Vicinamibacterales bacterium]